MKNQLIVRFFALLVLFNSCKKEEPAPFSITEFDPKVGVANTVVKIQGMGFSAVSADNKVQIGGSTAIVSAATENQLTATVAANTKTGKITVEVGGRVVTSADDFVVPEGPTPTSFSPESAEEGDEITIKGYNLGGTVVVKFNGIKATQVFSQSASQLSAIVPDGATTGKITLEASSKTNTTAKDFTVIYPLMAKATVTKLAAIPAFPTSGGDGVRMDAYDGKSLLITGPGQDAVYRLDLTTSGVSTFLTGIKNPVGITSSDGAFIGGDGDFYISRFDKLSKSAYSSTFGRYMGTVKVTKSATHPLYPLIATNFSNEIFGVTWGTAGGNSSSTHTTTKLNSQLKGIPHDASVMLATNSKGIFVFANQTLWKLLANNTLQQIAGTPGQGGYKDGKGAEARFQDGGYARGNAIAVDSDDNVFVADYGCGCIRKVDAQGTVTTVAGKKNTPNRTGKGHRMFFRFDSWDMTIAPDGSLYVIANNDVQSNILRNAVYKVIFDK